MSDPAAEARTPPRPPAAGGTRPLDLAGVGWMACLTFLWGMNAVTIKVVATDMAPIMGAALRSALALVPLTAYGWWRAEPWRHDPLTWFHALVAALLFAVEFTLVYAGARLTTGGHTSLFLNTAPIWVVLGAHFLLPDDRLTWLRLAGLCTAFGGIVLLFSDKPHMWDTGYWRGDLLVLTAAVLWGAQTLYIKRFLVGRMRPFAMLYVQILVSVPVMLAATALLETDRLAGAGWLALLALLYQAGVVVFFSYMMWMVLLQRYAASAMQSFTFLAPVWGVTLGIVLLDERFTPFLGAGLLLVVLGLYGINRPARPVVALRPGEQRG